MIDRTPIASVPPDVYLKERVEGQRRWFTGRANRYQAQRFGLGALVFLLSGAAGLVTSLPGPWMGMSSDQLAGLSGVLMSVTTAITGWATLSSTEYLSTTFRSTARQLRRLELDWYKGDRFTGALGFAQFVEEVERLLARQNASWSQRIVQTGQAAPPSAVPAGGTTGAPPAPAAPPVEVDPNEGEVGRVGGGS